MGGGIHPRYGTGWFAGHVCSCGNLSYSSYRPYRCPRGCYFTFDWDCTTPIAAWPRVRICVILRMNGFWVQWGHRGGSGIEGGVDSLKVAMESVVCWCGRRTRSFVKCFLCRFGGFEWVLGGFGGIITGPANDKRQIWRALLAQIRIWYDFLLSLGNISPKWALARIVNEIWR